MTKEERCLANISAWFANRAPAEIFPRVVLKQEQDRVWFAVGPELFLGLDTWLRDGVEAGFFTVGSHALHGPSATKSYREAVRFGSLQVTWHQPSVDLRKRLDLDSMAWALRRCSTYVHGELSHDTAIGEIDFDAGNPTFDELADAPGIILHGLEVLKNKLFRKKTNPFRIAWMLRKRGILPPEENA